MILNPSSVGICCTKKRMPLRVLCPARPSSPVRGRSTPIVIVLAAGAAGAPRQAGKTIRKTSRKASTEAPRV